MILTRVVEEERIVGPSVLYQPVHGSQDILLCRLAHRVLLVIREDHHVFALISKILYQVCRHVPNVVDASSELPALTEIVDAYEEGLPSARTLRILERIALRRPMAKVLWCRWRWWRSSVVPMDIRVGVHRRQSRPATILGLRRRMVTPVLLRWWLMKSVRRDILGLEKVRTHLLVTVRLSRLLVSISGRRRLLISSIARLLGPAHISDIRPHKRMTPEQSIIRIVGRLRAMASICTASITGTRVSGHCG